MTSSSKTRRPTRSVSRPTPTRCARGFTSDFCGAWLALWQTVVAEYGAAIEDATGEPCGPLVEAVRTSYMALISAAVRADKHRAQFRRFKGPAALLWSYRSGQLIPEGDRDDPERRRVLRNFARYWRADGWRPVFRFQEATHLSFFDREARTFKDNRKAAEAAHFTDHLTDLLGDIIKRKKSYRGGGCVERFNRAARSALEAFRREMAHACESPKTWRRPHPFAPDAPPEKPGGGGAKPGPAPKATVINFDQARKKDSGRRRDRARPRRGREAHARRGRRVDHAPGPRRRDRPGRA